jgi:hypothetical protein
MQMAAVNFTVAPLATRKDKFAVGAGADCQRAKNWSGAAPFSATQIADKFGAAELIAAPNTPIAAEFARRMPQFASSNNAGHAAPSKPNTTSGFTVQSNKTWQATVFLENFKER